MFSFKFLCNVVKTNFSSDMQLAKNDVCKKWIISVRTQGPFILRELCIYVLDVSTKCPIINLVRTQLFSLYYEYIVCSLMTHFAWD